MISYRLNDHDNIGGECPEFDSFDEVIKAYTDAQTVKNGCLICDQIDVLLSPVFGEGKMQINRYSITRITVMPDGNRRFRVPFFWDFNMIDIDEIKTVLDKKISQPNYSLG